MKSLYSILLSCLFLIYISQPVFAVSTYTTSEMSCCVEMAMDTSQEEMDCCDMQESDMEDCYMDSCSCPMSSCCVVFTPSAYKELSFPNNSFKQVYSKLSSALQSPFFTIWTPPDIA